MIDFEKDSLMENCSVLVKNNIRECVGALMKLNLKLIIIIGSLFLASCGGDGGSQSTPVVVTPPPPPVVSATVFGKVFFPEALPDVDVEVRTLSGSLLGRGKTDAQGGYRADVSDVRDLDADYIVVATGGVLGEETIETFVPGASLEADVTAISALISGITKRGGSQNNQSDALTARDRLVAFGMLSSGISLDATDDIRVFEMQLTQEMTTNGISLFLDTLFEDMSDNQVSAELGEIFPDIHGGVLSLRVEGGGVIEGIEGSNLSRFVLPEIQDADEDLTFTVIGGGANMSVDAAGRFTVSDLGPTDRLIEIQATSRDVEIGRRIVVQLEALEPILLLQGSLGPDGGRLLNAWKDIVISADAGVLNQVHDFRLVGAESSQNGVVFDLNVSPDLSADAMSGISLSSPSAEVIASNYLTTVEAASAQKMQEFQESPVQKNKPEDDANGIPPLCRRDWVDANGDGHKFDHLWQGRTARFLNRKSRPDNGPARVAPNETVPVLDLFLNHYSLGCASTLRSSQPKTNRNLGQPVLFVHGFQLDGDLGGNIGLLGGQGFGEYFGTFPRLIEELDGAAEGYTPFLFSWRTNASFNVVADDLAEAIFEINQATGKKVHIVAHSYGGILSRILLQGFAYNETLSGVDYTEHVATLTTVGTPHSGIAPGPRLYRTGQVSPIVFPLGRHGSGVWQISACQAVTCHQAGRNYRLIEGSPELYGAKPEEGAAVFQIASSLDNYPEIDTLVLMGADPSIVTCKRNSDGSCAYAYQFDPEDIGDDLISLEGQRFRPQDGYGQLYERDFGSHTIKERILDLSVTNDAPSPGLGNGILNFIASGAAGELFLGGNAGSVIFGGVGHTSAGSKARYINDDEGRRPALFDRIGDPLVMQSVSEVGLEICLNKEPTNCSHPTWIYMRDLLSQTVAEEVLPFQNVGIEATINLNGAAPSGNYVVSVFADERRLREFQVTGGTSDFRVAVPFYEEATYHLLVAPKTEGQFRAVRSFGKFGASASDSGKVDFGTIRLFLPEVQPELYPVDFNLNGGTVEVFNVLIKNADDIIIEEASTNSGIVSLDLPNGRYLVQYSLPDEQSVQIVCDVPFINGNSCGGTVSAFDEPYILETFDNPVDDATVIGIQYVTSPNGIAAKFTRDNESRIEYAYANGFPRAGTIEMRVNVSNAYFYRDFELRDDQDCALLFTTDVHQGDITFPGSTWFYGCKDGDVYVYIGENEREPPSSRPDLRLTAEGTNFRFNAWHTIGFSYGPEGRSISVNGMQLAFDDSLTQTIAGGGRRTSQGQPTFGESISYLWQNNQFDGAFEGLVDSIRVSEAQHDYRLAR